MKIQITGLFLLTLIVGCSTPTKNMQVNVNVKGLKKGTLYLERVEDSLIVAIDSFVVSREENAVLGTNLKYSELFYVQLDRNNPGDKNNRIPFFGDQGEITIHTTLDDYVTNADITGSPTQEVYRSYMRIINQFNNEELDLLAAYLNAQINENTDSLALLEKQSANLLKRKMLFTTNFAVNNANSVVAPYLALSELSAAPKSLLDTIANTMSEDVASSRYGKLLVDYLSVLEK
jgi:hypothetical protein